MRVFFCKRRRECGNLRPQSRVGLCGIKRILFRCFTFCMDSFCTCWNFGESASKIAQFFNIVQVEKIQIFAFRSQLPILSASKFLRVRTFKSQKRLEIFNKRFSKFKDWIKTLLFSLMHSTVLSSIQGLTHWDCFNAPLYATRVGKALDVKL